MSLPQSPAARAALAIGLSLLLHALVMFAPLVSLKPAEMPLPPLTAKLESLPKITPAPQPKRQPARPKPSPTVPVQPLQEDVATEEPSTVAEEEPQIDEAPAEAPVAEPVQARIPLPREAKLTFAVYQGAGGLKLGENVQRLKIEDGNYTLSSETQTTGLASIFKTFLMTQASQGKVDTQGLRPQRFSEARKQSQGTQDVSAEFDFAGHTIHFSNGGSTALPDNAQDFLSFLYQLSQLTLAGREIVPIDISNGKKLEHYALEIGAEETIDTPLGKLRALPLRKIHQPGEEGLIVWLALEYRLLPIKLQQIDRAGNVQGEMRISEIRVSEENAELSSPSPPTSTTTPETSAPPCPQGAAVC